MGAVRVGGPMSREHLMVMELMELGRYCSSSCEFVSAVKLHDPLLEFKVLNA
jgi:hypothetical protein